MTTRERLERKAGFRWQNGSWQGSAENLLDLEAESAWIGELFVPVWVSEGTEGAKYIWFDLNNGRPSDVLKVQLLEEDALKPTAQERHKKRFFLSHEKCVAVFSNKAAAKRWESENHPCRVRLVSYETTEEPE